MNYMYRRLYCATPFERFRADLRYFFRKSFKHVMAYVGEALLGTIWFLSVIFFLPVFAAFFH